jgi:hypothetical protein
MTERQPDSARCHPADNRTTTLPPPHAIRFAFSFDTSIMGLDPELGAYIPTEVQLSRDGRPAEPCMPTIPRTLAGAMHHFFNRTSTNVGGWQP